jgi:protein ImuB
METACVIDCRLVAPERPGRSGGLRPGRDVLEDAVVGAADDPVEAGEWTEAMARALEGIGAGVESERAGEIFFGVGGLRGLYGGEVAGVTAAARRAVEGAVGIQETSRDGTRGPGASRDGGSESGAPVLIGVAPTRTAARAAAERGELVVTEARLANFLAPLPTAVLVARLGPREREAEELVASLERLGIGTLGALARLFPDQVADRFGALGLRALRLARGEEEALRPRVPHEELVEEIELPEGVAGSQLDRALELLVDRLLAAPGRKGRTLLGVRLGARLCGGGSWSVDQGLGRPSAAAGVLRRLLVPRLEGLPGPAAALRLRALGFGPAAADQLVMEVGGSEPRRRRLGAAVREVRAAQGSDALLRVLPVDSGSRVPERRDLLTPFPEI